MSEPAADETIPACPECGSSQITRRNGRGRRHETDANWWCRCGARFDDAKWRLPKTSGTRGGLAGRLVDADPEKVGQNA